MSPTTITLPQCVLTLCDDGIVVCDQDGSVEQTRDTAKVLFDAIDTLSDEPVRFLVLMNGQQTDKEARAMFANTDRFRSVGMVVSSRVGTMLINFFLRVNRPGYPMRVFTSQDAARTWLLAET